MTAKNGMRRLGFFFPGFAAAGLSALTSFGCRRAAALPEGVVSAIGINFFSGEHEAITAATATTTVLTACRPDPLWGCCCSAQFGFFNSCARRPQRIDLSQRHPKSCEAE